VAEFKLESHSLTLGDEILITGPTTGIVQSFIDEIRVENQSADKIEKGTVFTVKINEKIRPSDKLYKLVDA
jgi:putative protease